MTGVQRQARLSFVTFPRTALQQIFGEENPAQNLQPLGSDLARTWLPHGISTALAAPFWFAATPVRGSY
ncbi:MAG: hypothetical protein JWR69_2887 [Pedosphaera sp.]|nr:hypothetical protein [Pedosphaera sp.]